MGVQDKHGLVVAIDFDGSCTTHEYPKIGKDIGAVPVLQRLVKNGHQLIIFTMRCDKELAEAVEWFDQNNISLYGRNNYNPTQSEWTKSNKAYAHLYIDDASAGCPIKWDVMLSKRPFIDWPAMENWLENNGYFKHEAK